MEDQAIVELFFARNETAIAETDRKYGRRLKAISYGILSSREDAEECADDTYLAAWNQIPPDRPVYFFTYLAAIIRNLSYRRYRDAHREKRGGLGNVLEELDACIPDEDEPALFEEENSEALAETLNGFLRNLPKDKRIIFVKRYYYSEATADIARETGYSEPNVRKILSRLRESLYQILRKGGHVL